MKIGKYITNIGVISAILGAIGVMRQTKNMPTDWRRFLLWGVWLLGVVLAIAGVAKQEEDRQFAEEQKG